MSRHRNVRDMDYGEEYDGYYEVYGHSVEDDCAVGVSPSTEREFMYRRSFHDNSLSSYMEKIGEGDAEDQADSDDEHPLQDSKDFSRPKLSDHDEARLNSCIDGIRNVMGDNVPEHVMIDTVLKTNFSLEKALDSILHTQTNEKQPAKKPVPNVVLQGPGAKPKNPQRTGALGFSFLNSTRLESKPSPVFNLQSPPKPTSSDNNVKDQRTKNLGNTQEAITSLNNPNDTNSDNRSEYVKGICSIDGINQRLSLGKLQGMSEQTVPLASLASSQKIGSNVGVTLSSLAKTHLGSGPKATSSLHLGAKHSPFVGQLLSTLANAPGGVKLGPKTSSLSGLQKNSSTAKPVSLSTLATDHLSSSPKYQLVGDYKGEKVGSPGQGGTLNSLATNYLSKERSGIPPPKTTENPVSSIVLKKSSLESSTSSSPEESSLTHRPKGATRRRGRKALAKQKHTKVETETRQCLVPQIAGELDLETSPMAQMSAFSRAMCAEPELRVLPRHLQSLSASPCHQSFSPPEPSTGTFQYKRQLSQTSHDNYKTIIPFDFSTPSPDDIIKEKHNAAFTRSKEGGKDSTNVNSKASDTMLTLPLQSTPPRKNFTSPTRGVTRGFNVASDDLNSGMGKRFSVDSGKKLDISVGQRLPTVRSTPDLVSMANSTPNRRESKSGSGKLGIDIAKAFEERQAEKPLLNLVVIGHVDAGKSTLMGHLLQQLGNVNQRTMHRYEQESKKQGKASFAYAWVLDETGEERQRGITMDVGINKFETEHRIITLLDAPGHKDFIPNMITGAAQADVAVLVVDATRGEFETGFESGGQTREHAMLVRSLGVTQLVVAVNKLDTVDWSEDRFNEIVQKLSHFLKQVAGFKESDLVYVPCSGLTGENLSKRTQEKLLRQWYKERSLLECIDSFKPPKRSLDKPFRHCVSDIFKGMGSGFSVSGKIVSGSVQVGQKVVVMPAGDSGVVKSVFIHEEDMKWACAGDHATLTVTGIDQMNVTVGNIICNVDQPIAACVRFRARIITFSLEIPITKGFQVLMHYQTLSEPATVRKLVSILHKSTGEVLKQKPRCLTKHTNAIIEIDVSRPISLELYKDFKDLGRFMLRYSGSTIAAGLVVEILK
ncbi:HBS1-like protein isoform X1 [Anneissia japonica]|uniref:HBS1-like protein isoform X1 n=1 Tax=Anneissia japonica TaxID=1529436 RepID=UPI001425AE75|nr:HBS1-like protein isoform X1 [Anneissia japonica]